ncbi:MAG: sigma-70 family RNA polymerase sigma factor [Actinomycetota bacterium]|nr:sigma-70 family RNA polymerase sigma factor [Actinomycetota bacterium]
MNQTPRQEHVSHLPEPAVERFEDFYRREYEQAVRLAWLLTGSRVGAEDVVQDAMSGVYRSFERVESAAGYLRRAVVNRARSWQRDERRQRDRLTLLAHQRSGIGTVDRGLLDAVGRLPYRQRVVIVTRYWGGWSENDIARALGCRPGTVKSLASRALSRLRAEVQP